MDWQALAQAVVDRRVELGYRTRDAFATATKLSPRLIADLEKARRTNYDQVTFVRLEKALQWPAGEARRILDGAGADDLDEQFKLIRGIYDMLPDHDQQAAIARLRVFLADLDRWLAAALVGQAHGK